MNTATDTIEGQQTDVERAAAEEAAAAETAFGSMRGAEPKPEAKPEEPPAKTPEEIEAEKKAEVERAKAAEEEWLKGAPQSVRESLSAISAVQGRLRNIEGHIGGLTSVTKELKTAISAARTAAEKSGGAAPTDSQVAAAAVSSEKWNRMKEDFPDWAEALDERLAGMPGKAAAVDVDSIRKQITEGITPELQAVERRAREFARVDIKHEDWEEVVKTPEFSTWFQAQPEDIQALAASDKARDAIKLLDAYKTAGKPNGPPADPPAKADPKARLEAAVSPTNAQTVTRRETITEAEAAEAAWKRVRGG